jgi:hypothetical protein
MVKISSESLWFFECHRSQVVWWEIENPIKLGGCTQYGTSTFSFQYIIHLHFPLLIRVEKVKCERTPFVGDYIHIHQHHPLELPNLLSLHSLRAPCRDLRLDTNPRVKTVFLGYKGERKDSRGIGLESSTGLGVTRSVFRHLPGPDTSLEKGILGGWLVDHVWDPRVPSWFNLWSV